MLDLLSGVAAAAVVAVISNMIHGAIVIGGQKPVSAVVLAILIGMALRSALGERPQLVPGLTFSVKKLLKLAIILLGFGLKLSAILGTGMGTLGIIVVSVVSGILTAVWLGKMLGLKDELALLIGTGTAICGATAIVAAAPAVGADDSDISYSVGTITIFGIVAIFLYPVLGRALGLSDTQFGTWAGTAIHETAQVLAAGFAYSDSAGNISAVVKLTRTVLLAPLVVVLGTLYARKTSGRVSAKDALKSFPFFVLWFILASITRTVVEGTSFAQSALWSGFLDKASDASKFLIVLAMAATGMMTDFGKMRSVGIKPFVSGLIASVFVGLLSLMLITRL